MASWHVVTGKDPYTGQALGPVTGAVPDHLMVHFRTAQEFSDRRRAQLCQDRTLHHTPQRSSWPATQ